jgi:hypothetical protein
MIIIGLVHDFHKKNLRIYDDQGRFGISLSAFLMAKSPFWLVKSHGNPMKVPWFHLFIISLPRNPGQKHREKLDRGRVGRTGSAETKTGGRADKAVWSWALDGVWPQFLQQIPWKKESENGPFSNGNF